MLHRVTLSGRHLLQARIAVATSSQVWLHSAILLLLFLAIYWMAFLLRFDFEVPEHWVGVFLHSALWFVGVKWLVFTWARAHQSWKQHVTFGDLICLVQAVMAAGLVLAAIDYLVVPGQVPRAVIILDGMLTLLVSGGLLSAGRWFREQLRPVILPQQSRRALLVAGDPSTGLLGQQINSHAKLDYRICGIVSTNVREARRRHGWLRVLGHIRDVREIARRRRACDVLAVAGSMSGRRMRWLMTTCERAELNLKIIPPLQDLFNGGRSIPLRGIEIGDLLRRSPVQLDNQAIRDFVAGRRLLVTGAGGSIGSEICRQVMRFHPSELVLLGRGENRIFQIESELRPLAGSTRLIPTIACITDATRMRQVFESHRPEVVFHAAAHKHVPLMEGNVGEALKNNVGGTMTLVDLADEYDVRSLVAISTDKAVNPTSVMGATKQLAERYIRALSPRSATRLVSVRLGNVLASAGSVVPLFQEQLRRGGPITVTSPEMTRYFMTIPEASQLVLQAGAMRHGELFVLDMGDPVRILDLARDLITLSGLPPESVDIRISGIRPGEKLHEELFGDGERRLPTSHAKLHLAQVDPSSQDLDIEERLLELVSAARAGAPESELFDRLADLVPTLERARQAVSLTGAAATHVPASSPAELQVRVTPS